MVALICFVLAVLTSPFKSKSRLEAENAVLRHQLIVLQRKVRGRAHLTNNDRGFFVQMYRWFPSIMKVVTIIEPETLVRWHRAGFRRYWRWKSRSRGGRPQIDLELRMLIRQMSMENLLWGAPRIHGELLWLFDVTVTSRWRLLQSTPRTSSHSNGLATRICLVSNSHDGAAPLQTATLQARCARSKGLMPVAGLSPPDIKGEGVIEPLLTVRAQSRSNGLRTRPDQRPSSR